MASTVNEEDAVAKASPAPASGGRPIELFISYGEFITLMTLCKMFKRKTSRRNNPKFVRKSQVILEKFGVEQLTWTKLEDGSMKLDTEHTPEDVSAKIIRLGRNVVDKLDEEVEKQVEADKARIADLQHEEDSVGDATHVRQNRVQIIEHCNVQIMCLQEAIYQLSRYKQELT
ncbi:uncharacterized protein AB675_2156 [Cyphellophora attinorum]|uniref:Uncharacterized protein n=1 Tax=Cyphellophora attinorum TaxID=1664694 RepID=A0A0N1P2W2_9EURO|nr:uncharacterized protein AB675_2156 [Phialophora attinorum]KPI43073.1 hypothetical protein AB675_2156 [Phialophora attinorum]